MHEMVSFRINLPAGVGIYFQYTARQSASSYHRYSYTEPVNWKNNTNFCGKYWCVRTKMGGIVRLGIVSMSQKFHSHTNLLPSPWDSIPFNWFARSVWNELSVSAVIVRYEGASVFTWKITRHVPSTHIQYHVQSADLGYVVGCPYGVILIYVLYKMPFSEKYADLFVLKMGAFSH